MKSARCRPMKNVRKVNVPQDLITDDNLTKPPHLAHNSLSSLEKMSLRKKRLLEQESFTVKKKCPSLETESVLKLPVVQLYDLKSEHEHQNQKPHVKKPDRGPLSDQGRQENRPADGALRSKLSPSSLAHNELLPSNIHFTNNQQKNTIENRVCTSIPKECLKVPVVRLFRFQPESQEEESPNVSDREQHHNQELQKTVQQDGPRVNISYTSLVAICKEKQPVVKLYRVDTQPDRKEEKQLSKLDSEQYSGQVPSPNTIEANDGIALSSLAQNARLPPNTDVRRKSDRHKSDPETVCLKQPIVLLNRLNIEIEPQLVRQVMDESDNEHQHDQVQRPDDSPLNMQPETPEEQSTDDSDSDQFDEEDLENFSEYELERLRNIKANSKFLKSLKLREVVSSLCQPRKSRLRNKREKPQSDMVIRQSKRLKGIEPSVPETEKFIVPKRADIPRGPIEMFPYNDVDHGAWRSFQDTWTSISQGTFVKPTSLKCRKLTSYANRLQSLTLEKRAVTSILHASISAIAIHPSNTRTLVAAGDSNGNVGLWDLKNQSAGVYQFPIHSSKTTAIAFSPSNPGHLLSMGREGSIRCGDLTHSVFDEIYHETGCLSSFDFLSADGSVLIVSHFDSKLSVVDRRTKTNTYDARGCLDLKYVHSVSVHPLKRDLCVVAGHSNVLIYDVRKLSKDLTQPVMGLRKHRGNTLTASFSPCTGKRILTRSYNKYVRVFRVENFYGDVYPVKVFRFHKAHLKSIAPVTWDPKQENCFAEGILSSGKINITHVTGQCVHTLSGTSLSHRPTALAIHPTRHLVVAGAPRGVLCVWKKWKNTLDPPEDKSLD